uniref:ionotropic receptor 114 n=1 Tax=Aedes aegypti TaxID=7159 RepID=UPI000C2554E5|nr:ionotropic receptor 114 [Aedes aegypti]
MLTNLLSPENTHLLHHWKSVICEPGHPNYVFYESNLSEHMRAILDHYLVQQSEPQTVITNIHRYLWTVPFDSCPMLFLEFGSNLNLLRYALRQRKIIISSAEFYQPISFQLISNKIQDVVFFIFNQSQWTVYYYDNLHETHNHWTTLDTNPLNEAVHDLAGAIFLAGMQNEMEQMFVEFVVSEMNATHREGRASTRYGLIYTYLMFTYGMQNQLIFMHRTSCYRVLVPRLDEPKAIISVLVDPFDIETWMTYGTMILVVTLFRTVCTRRWHCRQYLRSLQDVIACVILGSPIDFHQDLEQLIVGLFQLLSIVLMAAYESLVISFLLNPRFNPELDTIDLLNESCCFAWTLDTQNQNFQHIDDCLSVLWIDSYIPTPRDRGRFSCYLIDPSVGREMNHTLSHPAIAKYYRWSKVSIYTYPVLAIASGGIGMTKWIRYYASVFFAEGALYRFFASKSRLFARGDHKPEKVIKLKDLMLLWIAYFFGFGVSVVVFLFENRRKMGNGSRKWAFQGVQSGKIEFLE